jgi:hypothetical protein
MHHTSCARQKIIRGLCAKDEVIDFFGFADTFVEHDFGGFDADVGGGLVGGNYRAFFDSKFADKLLRCPIRKTTRQLLIAKPTLR